MGMMNYPFRFWESAYGSTPCFAISYKVYIVLYNINFSHIVSYKAIHGVLPYVNWKSFFDMLELKFWSSFHPGAGWEGGGMFATIISPVPGLRRLMWFVCYNPVMFSAFYFQSVRIVRSTNKTKKCWRHDIIEWYCFFIYFCLQIRKWNSLPAY